MADGDRERIVSSLRKMIVSHSLCRHSPNTAFSDTLPLLSLTLETYHSPCADLFSAGPTADFSEYISPSDARRSYLSHFTGSAGVALVTLPSPSISTSSSSSNSNPAFQSGRAILWTDSRYYLQAAQELDLKRDGGEGSWELMKLGMEGVKKLDDWLVEDYATTTSSSSSSGGIGEGEGKLRIGIDPKLIPYFRAKEISDLFAGKAADGTIKAKPKLKGRRELELVPVTGDGGGGGGSGNLVDRIWEKDGEGRVGRKVGRVFVLPEKYAGTLDSFLPPPSTLSQLPSSAQFRVR